MWLNITLLILTHPSVTAVSIGRVVLLVQGFFYPNRLNTDYTYNIGFCISAIETNLAIVTASAPHLRPLLKRWFPRLFGAPETWAFEGPYGGQNNYVTKPSTGSSGTKNKYPLRNGERFELGNTQGLAGIPHENRGESQEDIMTTDGIMKTTNNSVRSAEQGQWRQDTESSKSETVDYGMRTSVESL